MKVIIQASWKISPFAPGGHGGLWPDRPGLNDGTKRNCRVRLPGKAEEIRELARRSRRPGGRLPARFRRRRAGVRSNPSGLSSLQTNLVVTEILDAAPISAATGTPCG